MTTKSLVKQCALLITSCKEFYSNVSIRTKIRSAFIALLLLSLVITVSMLVYGRKAVFVIANAKEYFYTVAHNESAVRSSVLQMALEERSYLLSGDVKSLALVNTHRRDLKKAIDRLEHVLRQKKHEEGLSRIAQLREGLVKWETLSSKLIDLHEDPISNNVLLAKMNSDYIEGRRELISLLSTMLKIEKDRDSSSRLYHSLELLLMELEYFDSNLFAYAYTGELSFKINLHTARINIHRELHNLISTKYLMSKKQRELFLKLRARSKELPLFLDTYVAKSNELTIFRDRNFYVSEMQRVTDAMLFTLDMLLVDYRKKLSLDYDSIRGNLRATMFNALLVSALSFLLALAFALFFSEILFRPIKKLTKTAEKIASGDLSARSEISYNDEIGMLGASFNKMAETLNVTIEELKAKKRVLEKSVGDRTREIQYMNEELHSEIRHKQSTQEALDESEEKYRTLFNASADAICIVDPYSGRVLDLNRTAASMFGFSHQHEHELSRIFPADPPYRWSDIQEHIHQALKSGRSSVEWMLRGGESDLVWSEILFQKIVIRYSLRLMISIRDITEQKRSKEQLIQAQKMETIGTLAGGIAHDFNNVLSGIAGSISLLKFQLEKDTVSDEDLSQFVNILETSSDRAGRVVKKLLTLSRKHEIEMKRVDLNDSIENVIHICSNTIDKSIEIRTRYYPDHASIYGDATSIEQILLNLLINASHAMTIMRPEGQALGGVLSIAVDLEVDIDEDAYERKQWRITISDTGVGMTDAVRAQIFDPFYSTKGAEKGTGLGLAMAYNLVKLHGGTIALDSTPGKGSDFYLTFPLYDEESRRKGQAKAGVPDFSRVGTVLVVDDEAMVRGTLAKMLQYLGLTVIEASSGLQSLKIFKEEHENIKLVILDVLMPGMGGDEVLLKLNEIDKSVPVLLASGYADEKRMERIREEHSAGFLQKPFSFNELTQTLSEIFSDDLE